jgi:hypothetical protein
MRDEHPREEGAEAQRARARRAQDLSEELGAAREELLAAAAALCALSRDLRERVSSCRRDVEPHGGRAAA